MQNKSGTEPLKPINTSTPVRPSQLDTLAKTGASKKSIELPRSLTSDVVGGFVARFRFPLGLRGEEGGRCRRRYRRRGRRRRRLFPGIASRYADARALDIPDGGVRRSEVEEEEREGVVVVGGGNLVTLGWREGDTRAKSREH